MKSFSYALIVILIFAFVITGIIIYCFFTQDFVGHNDPVAVEASKKYMDDMLLSAEFRNGPNYYAIQLVDTNQIVILLGDKAGGINLYKKYCLKGDTIQITNGVEEANKYLSSKNFLINGDKIFMLDSSGKSDTSKGLKIQLNRLK